MLISETSRQSQEEDAAAAKEKVKRQTLMAFLSMKR
jgi:hypothetical protein